MQVKDFKNNQLSIIDKITQSLLDGNNTIVVNKSADDSLFEIYTLIDIIIFHYKDKVCCMLDDDKIILEFKKVNS